MTSSFNDHRSSPRICDRRTPRLSNVPAPSATRTTREEERPPDCDGGNNLRFSGRVSPSEVVGSSPSPRVVAVSCRRRAFVAGFAVVATYLSWNVRLLMSSSLRMLAAPGRDVEPQRSNPSAKRSSITSTRNASRHPEPIESNAFTRPSICLLMSFPNSGTSYTLKNTQLMSGRVVATNFESDSKQRVPLFAAEATAPGDSEMVTAPEVSPYILNATFARTGVVLTKTHCGMQSQFEPFERSCRSVRRVVNNNIQDVGAYPIEHVHSAVHLIRSPFDNVVARMHMGVRKNRGILPESTLATFTNDPEGFHNWCKYLDATYWRIGTLLPDPTTRELLKSVPCHSDVLHYVGWHNFALEFVRVHNLRYHALHYEDYGTDFARTATRLLDFLGLEPVGDPAPFQPGKSYAQFYSEEERTAMTELLSRVCTPPLWKLLGRYLPPVSNRTAAVAADSAPVENVGATVDPAYFAFSSAS